MTWKQLILIFSSAIVILFGLVIFAYVRLNTLDGRIAEQTESMENITADMDTLKALKEREEPAEPEATPEPVVYVVSPVTAFDAYTVEAAPYFTLPAAESEPDGTLEAGSNLIVSGVCGDFYYTALPDGTTCYVPQQYLAQVPDPTPEPTPDPTPEPTPEVTPVPEATPEAGTESTVE